MFVVNVYHQDSRCLCFCIFELLLLLHVLLLLLLKRKTIRKNHLWSYCAYCTSARFVVQTFCMNTWSFNELFNKFCLKLYFFHSFTALRCCCSYLHNRNVFRIRFYVKGEQYLKAELSSVSSYVRKARCTFDVGH